VMTFLHTWLRTGRQQFHEAFLFDYLVKSFLHTWLRTGRQRNQEAFIFVFSYCPYFTLGLEMVDKEIKRPTFLIINCSPFLIVHFKLVE
jgi:hypothetical protein